jgi:hypothetical protein
VNATGVEITPGGAAAFIEDATKYWGFLHIPRIGRFERRLLYS